MVTRYEWRALHYDLKNRDIDITPIFREAMIFLSMANRKIRSYDITSAIVYRWVMSEVHINTCRRLLKNHLNPDENPFIKEEKENYNWFIDNLGRVDLKVSDYKDTAVKITMGLELGKKEKLSNLSRLSQYSNFLTEIMAHLVYYPLFYGYKRFLSQDQFYDKKGNQLERDENLFWALVFQEYFHSSESLGAITSQKSLGTPRSFGIVSSKPSRYRMDSRGINIPGVHDTEDELEDQEISIQEPFDLMTEDVESI